jgi:hypothetical protein
MLKSKVGVLLCSVALCASFIPVRAQTIDQLVIKKNQVVTGPQATGPSQWLDAIDIQTSVPVIVDDRGRVVAPSGRAIQIDEDGNAPITVTGNGVAKGEGPDCPGGVAQVPKSSLVGMIGCSGIRAVAQTAGDRQPLTVKWRGRVSGTSAGINAISAGSGNVSVTLGSGAHVTGIYEFGVENLLTGDANVTDIARRGSTIRSAGVGIYANDSGNGSVNITNRGRVIAGATPYNGVVNVTNPLGVLGAIEVADSGQGEVSLRNTGLVAVTTVGDEAAVSNAANVRLLNTGKIKGGVEIGGTFSNLGTWNTEDAASSVGKLILSAASVIHATIGSVIDVAHAADLGGTLQLNIPTDTAPGQYDILKAGKVSGRFASVTSDVPVTITYRLGNVLLNVYPPAADLPFNQSPLVESQRDCLKDKSCTQAPFVGHGGAGANPVPIRPLPIEDEMRDW